jgi:hypothetical protein
LEYYYFKQKSGLYYRTTYAIDSTKAEIIVFGSSRASHHYVPDVFEDNLKLSFYNCGREGNFLLYNYAIFRAIVKRHKPKIVIFDINPTELYHNKESYERLSSLLPYYGEHSEIREIVEFKSHYEKYKFVSRIYPYNSALLTIAIGNIGLNKFRKNDNKGYVALDGHLQDTIMKDIELAFGVSDPNIENVVLEIVQYCNINNIKLIFLQSPMFGKVQHSGSAKYFEKLALENKIIYWDFTNSKEFLNKPSFFQDALHLNEIGADYFSQLVVKKINNLY